MKRKTNNERIIEYMREHGSITARAAVYDLGILRLAARIHEIKRDTPIRKRTEYKTRPDGTTVHWTVYSLGDKQ